MRDCLARVAVLFLSFVSFAPALGHEESQPPGFHDPDLEAGRWVHVDVGVMDSAGAMQTHTLSFQCVPGLLNVSAEVCGQAGLSSSQCSVLQHYANNKKEAHCPSIDGSALDPPMGSILSQHEVDGHLLIDGTFHLFGSGADEEVSFTPQPHVAAGTAAPPGDLRSRLAENVTGPWVSRGVSHGDLEVILEAEVECIVVAWLPEEGEVVVWSPNQPRFDADKWFLFRRRHDAVELVKRLAETGKLGSSAFEIAFCPRDCVVGGFNYNYSGMPPVRGPSNQELPVFGIVACKGSANIPLPILSRRTADYGHLGWDEMVAELKANREAYPWAQRKNQAIFRGELYGRSCWDGTQGGTVEQRDTIKCGRPRLMWFAEERLGEWLDVDINFMPLFRQENFRMQVVAEGHCGWADRLQYLVNMGSLVLMQETMCRQWFALSMEPWVHYVPLNYHFNNLEKVLAWARDPANEQAVRQIISNCQTLADVVLTSAAIDEYAMHVFSQYVKALRYDVSRRYQGWKRREDMWRASDYLDNFVSFER